jgi:Kef-type K+ transport system membrane component KefB
MNSYAIFLFTIGVALLLGKIFSSLLEKKGIPGVLGEIFAGLFLGTLIQFFPSMTNIIDTKTEDFDFISRLGIVFLLFLAGLQTDLKELKATGKVAFISTIGGVLVPLFLGFYAVKLFGFNDKEAFGIGVMLTATSIGITVRVMMDLGVLNTRVGTASLSASVIDDFIGIALVVLITGIGNIWLLIFNMIGFIIVSLFIGWYTIDKILIIFEKLSNGKTITPFCIGLMFLFATFAEFAFAAAIEGSFILGIILCKCHAKIQDDIKAITYGIFAPLFFIRIGSIVDIRVFAQIEFLFFAFVIVLIAIVGKVFGRGIFARISGFSWKESLQTGIGSIPRMEVALISLTVVINAGIFTDDHLQIALAGAMVFVTVTTLITPMLLKKAFKNEIKNMIKTPPEK